MNRAYALTIFLGVTSWWLSPTDVEAGVVVIANRSRQEVSFKLVPVAGKAEEAAIRPGAVVPIPVRGKLQIVFASGEASRRYDLKPNCVYCFVENGRQLDFQQVELGEEPAEEASPAPPVRPVSKQTAAGIVTVKILVDDKEPGTRKTWEDRLRQRVQSASEIIRRHGGPRLEVVAVGTWSTDDRITDLQGALLDFEHKVDPSPAQLAVGFSRQYRMSPEDFAKSGGLRAPLYTHMLIPDPGRRAKVDEQSTMFLHELGHYLGATHSPEPTSVMRVQLGSLPTTEKAGTIVFDPLNTLIMSLVAEEVRTRGVRSLPELSPATRQRAADAYAVAAQSLPGDPTASGAVQVNLVTEPARIPKELAKLKPALLENARSIRAAIVRAAEENEGKLKGDELCELYYRRAAAAAKDLPADQAAGAFLLGLAVALDTTGWLRTNPLSRGAYQAIEPDVERQRRVPLIGRPTMHGRPDLIADFAASAALTALAGAEAAEMAGTAKEVWNARAAAGESSPLRDARGSAGFSFVHLAADLAGIAMAEKIEKKPASLSELATEFKVSEYLPDPAGLREGISWQSFLEEYGSAVDARFRAERESLKRRLQGLPAYRLTKVPQLKEITVPDFPGAYAIWGAIGRDSSGKIWFGVSAEGVPQASAHLFEYDPAAGKAVDRGDVVFQLRQSAAPRSDEQQGMICSTILQAADGHLYFASIGEDKLEPDGSRQPPWGSHLWRLKLPERRWEHLAAVPDGLIAVACHGQYLYALGYPGHVVYQYHLPGGEVRKTLVGSAAGHVSRSLISDHRGHLYVPRVELTSDKGQPAVATLVELDPQLRKVAETPITHYLGTTPGQSRGIIGCVSLADKTIIFATHGGGLYRIFPRETEAAEIRPLLQLDMVRKAAITSMAADAKQRYLVATSMPLAGTQQVLEWIAYDVQENAFAVYPAVESSAPQNMELWGPGTTDSTGAIYMAGTYARGPLQLPSRLIEVLKARGFPDAKLAQLGENAKRSHQPLLFVVQSVR